MMNFHNLAPTELGDGFWADGHSQRRIGAVALVKSGYEILLVRKARRPGYELSGKLVLPGGMIRPLVGEEFIASVLRSLHERVTKETGCTLPILTEDAICKSSLCPVTSYYVAGRQRFTVVVPTKMTIADKGKTVANDPSVSEAFWVVIDQVPLQEIGPANMVILADLLKEERPDLRSSEFFLRAKAQCEAWLSLSSAARPN